MKTNTYAWIAGIIVGIVVAVFAVLRFMNKDGAIKTKYDERQQKARGKAYKWGMWSMVITLAVMMLIEMEGAIMSSLGAMSYFIPIIMGIVVQVSYSIFADAYVGLNTNMTRYIVIMIVISAFNLFVGVMAIVHGQMLMNGQLAGAFSNLCVGIMFIVVAIELIIKKMIDGREERDAE